METAGKRKIGQTVSGKEIMGLITVMMREGR